MESNVKWNGVLIGIFIVLFIMVILFFAFSVKVPVWYSAIKVNLYAQEVEPEGLHTWRNFYNSITSDVYKYPIFIQQTEYRDLRFQDKDGLLIVADIWMDYKFDEAQIGSLYEEYRAGVSKITNNYMRTWVKNAINRASSEFEVDALYWPDKEEFRLKVLDNLQKDLNTKWIVVNNVYFTDDMELPMEVVWRINAKIEATQKAMQKENELRAIKAEAQKTIAEAEWVAEAEIIRATAVANANKMINASITSTLIEYERTKKWDGKLPQLTWGWAIPMINIK